MISLLNLSHLDKTLPIIISICSDVLLTFLTIPLCRHFVVVTKLWLSDKADSRVPALICVYISIVVSVIYFLGSLVSGAVFRWQPIFMACTLLSANYFFLQSKFISKAVITSLSSTTVYIINVVSSLVVMFIVVSVVAEPLSLLEYKEFEHSSLKDLVFICTAFNTTPYISRAVVIYISIVLVSALNYYINYNEKRTIRTLRLSATNCVMPLLLLLAVLTPPSIMKYVLSTTGLIGFYIVLFYSVYRESLDIESKSKAKHVNSSSIARTIERLHKLPEDADNYQFQLSSLAMSLASDANANSIISQYEQKKEYRQFMTQLSSKVSLLKETDDF